MDWPGRDPCGFVPGRRVTQDEISSEIGRALARRRKELRLSLSEVSRRCGVSLQQVHKYETGQSVMSAPMLFQLALCLDVSASYFFEALEERRKAAAASEP